MRLNVIKSLVFLCSVVFVTACTGNDEYVLTGKFENAAAPYALIRYGKTLKEMDTIPLAADGSFRYARKLEEPSISFMMVPETGFFSVIMINGTNNHIEADLAKIGDCHITGDLADANALFVDLQNELQAKSEQAYDSFEAADLALSAFRNEAEKRVANISNADFRRMELWELDRSGFYNRLTWFSRLQEANLTASSDPDYNRFMLECDIEHINYDDYQASGLRSYYFAWCRQYRKENGGKDTWQYVLSLVGDKIANPQLRERVYMNILTEFFAGEDADNEVEAVYAQSMKLLQNATYREDISRKYEIFKKLRPGAPAIECELEDINGQTYKFSDLRGKAVYLDVWATWCAPCCKEIPYMEKLAAHFKNDPRIRIVSISVDANRKAWENKLKEDKPEWKQYLMKKFCNLYNINGIPRFMMFDKKGKIITVDAPRPSDPEIISFIESRLK